MSANMTPTESGGLPQFTIQPPTTIQDDGSPSDSLKKDAKRVLRFIADERHLVAGELLESIRKRLEEFLSSSKDNTSLDKPNTHKFTFKRSATAASTKQKLELQKDVQEASTILKENQVIISLLEVRTIMDMDCVFALLFLLFGPSTHSTPYNYSFMPLSLSLFRVPPYDDDDDNDDEH
jgi:hypothetical protein